MTTKFIMSRDINGYNGFGLPFSDTNYSATITTGAVTALTVPGNSTSDKYLAVFSYTPGGSVYYNGVYLGKTTDFNIEVVRG